MNVVLKNHNFVGRLLDWYDDNPRDYPWRENKDPYCVWLSEIMLQQTQVTTVISYYHRWLKRFPSIKDVASASIDEVLKYWEGLGYYSRARNFHQSCRQIINDGGETFLSKLSSKLNSLNFLELLNLLMTDLCNHLCKQFY